MVPHIYACKGIECVSVPWKVLHKISWQKGCETGPCFVPLSVRSVGCGVMSSSFILFQRDSWACKYEVCKYEGLFWNVQLHFASIRKTEGKNQEYQESAKGEQYMQNYKYNWKAGFKLFWAAKQFNLEESWAHNGN